MKSLAQRFEEKYVVHPETACWLWAAYVEPITGYAKIKRGDGSKSLLAHRVSYELHKGQIPSGLQIDHICRTRSCVNPFHLRAVTQQENVACGAKAMRTHCNHGHEFTKENTSLHHGYRRCKTCHREQERKRNV